MLCIIYDVYNTVIYAFLRRKKKWVKMHENSRNICVFAFFCVPLCRFLREYARTYMKRNGKIGFYY